MEVKKLFSTSIETYQSKAHLVGSAEIYRGCAIACAQSQGAQMRLAAPQAADELLGISGVIASFVLYETDGVVNFSARSMGALNVQVIMEKLGGGGHQTMAGAQMHFPIPETEEEREAQKGANCFGTGKRAVACCHRWLLSGAIDPGCGRSSPVSGRMLRLFFLSPWFSLAKRGQRGYNGTILFPVGRTAGKPFEKEEKQMKVILQADVKGQGKKRGFGQRIRRVCP